MTKEAHPHQLDGVPQNASEPLCDLLCDQVQKALTAYLQRMDGHGHVVSDLHTLVIHEVERPLIATVLEYFGHNQTRAAQALGLSRSTLRKKMQIHSLS